jgi:hypothetical protein
MVTAEAIPGEDTPSESWCVQEEARTPLFNARATFTDWKKETLADFYHGEQIVEWMQNDIQSFCRLEVIHFFFISVSHLQCSENICDDGYFRC